MADQVRAHETHSAVVVLIGDRAYKIKKPVDLGFLDFTTPDSRRDACRRELALNRRLAPDVYLEVATLARSDGRPCEYVLVMKRLPDEAQLSTLASEGRPLTAELRGVARVLASFHAAALPPADRLAAAADGVLHRWMNLLDVARSEQVVGTDDLDEIESLAHRYVEGRRTLFDRRAADGHVVDGHGDLRADDIFCLPDGPRLLDCLDFDDGLRAVDVLDDVAFLAMDLERLGRAADARLFVAQYIEFSGSTPHPSLLDHYIGHRAFVRSCVAAVSVGQGDASAGEAAHELAGLALRHLRAGEVRLVLVGGAPGTGKSTIAGLVANQLDADLVSSDGVRRELLDGRPDRYAAWAVSEVYAEVIHRARDLLLEGRTVVLDATWGAAEHRAAASALAAATTSRLVELECHAPAALCAERATVRARRDHSDSEADAEVAVRLAATRDAWPTAIPVDTEGSSPADALRALTSALETAPVTLS